jgi:hypothetical protein
VNWIAGPAGREVSRGRTCWISELARDVMCAVASDILLARAPRKENVLGIRLPWISWQGDGATVRVPNVEVKMRTSDDPDLCDPARSG